MATRRRERRLNQCFADQCSNRGNARSRPGGACTTTYSIQSHPSIRPIHAHTDYGGVGNTYGDTDVHTCSPGPPPMLWQVGCSDPGTVDTCFSELQEDALSTFHTARWFPACFKLGAACGRWGWRRYALPPPVRLHHGPLSFRSLWNPRLMDAQDLAPGTSARSRCRHDTLDTQDARTSSAREQQREGWAPYA